MFFENTFIYYIHSVQLNCSNLMVISVHLGPSSQILCAYFFLPLCCSDLPHYAHLCRKMRPSALPLDLVPIHSRGGVEMLRTDVIDIPEHKYLWNTW